MLVRKVGVYHMLYAFILQLEFWWRQILYPSQDHITDHCIDRILFGSILVQPGVIRV